MYTKDGFHKALEQKLGDDAYLLLADGGHKKLADLLTSASLGASGNSTTLSVTVGGTTKSNSITVPYATVAGTWETERTLTIGSTGKSVNGSKNVTWSLDEIGAAAAVHNHDDRYVNVSGDTMTGDLHVYAHTYCGYGTGSSIIDYNVYAMYVGTNGTRTGTAGSYIGGIAFTHMLKYSNGYDYINSPQGWIGLRTVDYPGSERSSLVFATKQGTGTSNTGDDIPIERMCITPAGNVGIGVKSPSCKLHMVGVNGETLRLSMPSSNYTAGAGPSLTFCHGESGELLASIRGVFNETNQGNRANLLFGTRTSDANGVETKMTILHNGNTGIGTTSPSYPLETIGKIVSSSSANSVRLIPDADCGMYMTSSGQWLHIAGNGGLMLIYNGAWDNSGKANHDKGITINTSNNIGIGTKAPSYKLDVNGIAHATRVIINNANVGNDSLTVGGCIRITGGATTSNMNAGLRRIFFGDGTNACLGEGGDGGDTDWMYIRGYHKILLETNAGSTTIDINGYLNSPGFIKNNSSDSYVLLGGGGHKTESSLSVNYAVSAGSVAWDNVSSKPATATRWPTWDEVTTKPSAIGSGTQPVYWNGSTFVACTTYDNASVNSATTATILLTSNTAQAADACYNENPGLRFWRYNGTSSTTGQSGGDGWIMSWSWNSGSVGGQIYLDDNPSKTICIRGRNNDANKTFTTWATILHSDNYTSYVNQRATSKTIWGQTYIDSNGNFLDVSGNITTAHHYMGGYLYMKFDGSWLSTIDNDGNGPIFGYQQAANSRRVYYCGSPVYICGGSYSNYASGITVDSSNNVGIGTTTPQIKLHVNGKFHVYYATESAPTDDLFSSSFASFGEYNDDGLWIGKDTSHNIWLQSAYKVPSTAKYKLLLNPLGGNVGISTSSPSVGFHANCDTTIGSRSWYYQRGGRGAVHHEFTGYDDDYGVMKIRHIHSDGSGGPGSYTATLGIHDERINNISGSYEPTLFVNRSGATRVPDLIGVNIGGTRYFTVNSSGNTILNADLYLRYASTSSDQWIVFQDSSSTETVKLGIRKPLASYGPTYVDKSGNYYLLIHSGNIGSQSVNYANSAGSASSATNATNLMPENTPHYFRDSTNASWRGGMFWGSAGSESMSFVVVNGGTRFQFVGGSDIASWNSNTWQNVTPYLTIHSSGIVTSGSATAKNFISNIATGTQPYACTSTTCNTNLNADYLDGYHASGLFETLSFSGSTLTVKIGGTQKTCTISVGTTFSLNHQRVSDSTNRYVLGTTLTNTSASSLNGNTIYSASQFYFTSSGAYHTSDIRKKYDIRDIYTDEVTRLFNTDNAFIRHFKWKDTDHDAYGFIAQELAEYCPEAVDLNNDTGYYAVNYNVAFSKIIGAMYKEIKHLREEVKILKGEA